MHRPEWKKYILAFLITAAVFGTALFASNYFNQQRVAEIENIQEQISTDILSLETQFELFQQLSCSEITEGTVLSGELNSLARRLSFTEGQLGPDNPEVLKLKRQYSLLQIKDYLLMKKITKQCDIQPVFILYFYSNRDDCPECKQMGNVLTYLREQYPALRVYSFDYHLDLTALATLKKINDIQNRLPAVVIGDEVYYGMKTRVEMEELLPRLDELERATSTATTTNSF